MIQFNGANGFLDDGTSDNNFTFVTGTAGNVGTTNATVGQAGGNAEALLLINGVLAADLTNLSVIATAINAEFVINGVGGATNGEDALLVVDASDGNSFGVYQWIQAGGGETAAAELTLIGTFAANAQVTTGSFDFV